MCVCGLTGLGKSEVVPSSCNLFNFFSSFPVFNKSHGDFFCVQGFILWRFITLWGYYMKSEALSGSQWKQPRIVTFFNRGNILLCFGRFYIMWHLWHYRLSQGWWRKWKICTGKDKHTHTHTEEDLNALILLFLMGSYFLAFIFCLCFFFICICCCLISVKHFLTNLFDKSTW